MLVVLATMFEVALVSRWVLPIWVLLAWVQPIWVISHEYPLVYIYPILITIGKEETIWPVESGQENPRRSNFNCSNRDLNIR